MSISVQSYCKDYLLALHQGVHDWSSDTFMLALYTPSAPLSRDTTEYTAFGEVSGYGYQPGGVEVVVASGYPLIQDTQSGGFEVLIDLEDVSVAGGAFTTRYALIYNASKDNRAVAVLDFGQDYYVEQNLTIVWPDPVTQYTIIRIGV